jgi:cell wall-associated NlpC family hydrolase
MQRHEWGRVSGWALAAALVACAPRRAPVYSNRPPLMVSTQAPAAPMQLWTPVSAPTLPQWAPSAVPPLAGWWPGWQLPAPQRQPRDPRRAPPALANGRAAAAYAEMQRGKPYCWGGAGPDCFDCSGLTSTAWRKAGRPIPRTSGEQRELPPVPMAALELGDILWRPGHVGIYVGRGMTIHAPGRGKPIAYQRADRFLEAHRPR